jgi:hypothetical protein
MYKRGCLKIKDIVNWNQQNTYESTGIVTALLQIPMMADPDRYFER